MIKAVFINLDLYLTIAIFMFNNSYFIFIQRQLFNFKKTNSKNDLIKIKMRRMKLKTNHFIRFTIQSKVTKFLIDFLELNKEEGFAFILNFHYFDFNYYQILPFLL